MIIKITSTETTIGADRKLAEYDKFDWIDTDQVESISYNPQHTGHNVYIYFKNHGIACNREDEGVGQLIDLWDKASLPEDERPF